jgi:hypothetical protein
LSTLLSEYQAMTLAPAAVAQSRIICISRGEGQAVSGRPHRAPHISAHEAACVTAQNGLPNRPAIAAPRANDGPVLRDDAGPTG